MNRRQFRIAEIFGPTIQGEGRNVGMPCHFVRFGGCDFRCTWCDTPHAVLPDLVAELDKGDEYSIIRSIENLNDSETVWVVLTGGNPALLNLDHLLDLFHLRGKKVMLETQGSVFREWFGKVDDLCFSPKPPSAHMDWSFDDFDRILVATRRSQREWAEAEKRQETHPWPYLKVPIFTDEDLEFAATVHELWPSYEFFLSIGNDDPALPTVGNPTPQFSGLPAVTREIVIENQKHWTERVLNDRRFRDARIFSQQHVLLWGNARGH